MNDIVITTGVVILVIGCIWDLIHVVRRYIDGDHLDCKLT